VIRFNAGIDNQTAKKAMRQTGEEIPQPIAYKKYNSKFMVHVPCGKQRLIIPCFFPIRLISIILHSVTNEKFDSSIKIEIYKNCRTLMRNVI
jgi:hypothetical protein